MNEVRQKYYPTILQSIHLLILYMFIQTIVDFPLALVDYYKDTEYLYNPVKKIVLGVGSTLFILIYGFKKSKAPFLKVFPLKMFNPLILIPIATFFWGIQNLLNDVNAWVEKMIPAPVWFWEMFSKIFDSDFGWWGAFIKVAVVAPVVEELIFRGIILQGLRRNYNAFVAVFMSALLFSLYHLNPWQMPATFILGLLLGWIMIRTNNIVLSILGHSINNLLVLLTITYWEKISAHAIYLLEKQEFMYLSGLVVALSVILIFLLSIKWRKDNRK
ncbi:CPBP family intramembrane glutamic endopeptidase [Maribellus maritimus]|uniref:CPBP family intramembrane glutamic endopeptidase n=1 Tax=Maribellus maritimus TaxID=2870838 RepID=UPI001EEAF25D|nr:type II CAAX endopeptidase family protein [Maribellus maritimus]MCG6188335.1 CPBP family intramembrane metalloprotease [Maribellus maritimus]